MIDTQVFKILASNRDELSLAIDDARRELADAIMRAIAERTHYSVACQAGYDGDPEFIVRVFNVTDDKTISDIDDLLQEVGVADVVEVWSYTPEETKRYYPAYYKEAR